VTRRRKISVSDLLGDPGVLDETPTLEVFGFEAVSKVGGVAVLPHRRDWLDARAAGITAQPEHDEPDPGSFNQAVVHLQKSRDATWQALHETWRRLDSHGRLLLIGGNNLGIKSAIKRLTGELGHTPTIVVNRARARIACWRRVGSSAPHRPDIADIEVTTSDRRFTLSSAAGVFSADAVDEGSALLLEHLEQVRTPSSVFDPGCGLGVLGLFALKRWPTAAAVLADADHRAVACSRANARRLGLDERCEVMWWDALSEPAPAGRFDLVLLNPPFHSGVPVDLQPARAIFETVNRVLAPAGRAIVVANRTLPWERDLREIGRLRQLAETRRYKVLEIRR
jgi:16S rRNA (guanine1207-N2)-methyltransferase